jgi:hypothetical protein
LWCQLGSSRDDVGLALTKRARGASPAAELDIAGGVEFGRVVTTNDLIVTAASRRSHLRTDESGVYWKVSEKFKLL